MTLELIVQALLIGGGLGALLVLIVVAEALFISAEFNPPRKAQGPKRK